MEECKELEGSRDGGCAGTSGTRSGLSDGTSPGIETGHRYDSVLTLLICNNRRLGVVGIPQRSLPGMRITEEKGWG